MMKLSSRFSYLVAVLLIISPSIGLSQMIPPPPEECSQITSEETVTLVYKRSDGESITLECSRCKKNGRMTIRAKEGYRVYEANFVDSIRHGWETKWHPNGRRSAVTLYRHGVQRQLEQWTPEGRPVAFGRYDWFGQPEYWIAWSEEGEIISAMGIPPAELPPDLSHNAALRQGPIPPNVFAESDQYIIERVGKSYFEQNYRLLRSKCDYRRDSGITLITVRYEYAPLVKIGSDALVGIGTFVNGDSVEMGGFVGNLKDGVVLEPVLTRSQAISKALGSTTEHLRPDQVHVFMLAPRYATGDWIWNLEFGMSSEAGVYCFGVDAVTGKVMDRGVRVAME